MAGKLSVHPGELDAGAGKVLGLVDTTKTAATDLAQTLVGMVSSAGHPTVSGALAQVVDAATKVMLDTAALFGFVGQNLKETARSYDATDVNNAKHMHNAL